MWLRGAVILGCVVGVALVVRTLGVVSGVDLRLTILLVAISQAFSAAAVAAIVLVVTGVQRLNNRPLSIATSRAPRVIAAIGGVSMVIATVVLSTIAFTEMVVLGIAGAMLTAFAARSHRLPWTVRDAALALLATTALFELPREADWVGLTWYRSGTHTQRNNEQSTNCTATNWGNKPLDVKTIARSVRVSNHLYGNVGELLPHGQEFGGDGELLFTFSGRVEIGWLPCLLPLYKPVTVQTSLPFTMRVTTRRGERNASCGGTGMLSIHVEHTVSGIAACRDVREQVAAEVAKQLDAAAHAILGR